jgi:hypothetical protein
MVPVQVPVPQHWIKVVLNKVKNLTDNAGNVAVPLLLHKSIVDLAVGPSSVLRRGLFVKLSAHCL